MEPRACSIITILCYVLLGFLLEALSLSILLPALWEFNLLNLQRDVVISLG